MIVDQGCQVAEREMTKLSGGHIWRWYGPVGASLLANAVIQTLKQRLADCFREQARSHKGYLLGRKPLWEAEISGL